MVSELRRTGPQLLIFFEDEQYPDRRSAVMRGPC